MTPALRHPKRRGEWVELKFMARATQHGLTVSKPWGDSARYDLVVEYRGRFFRIQVKSSQHGRKTSRGRCYTSCIRPNHHPHGWYAGHVEFFAFYLIPEDLWYIVPAPDLARAGNQAAVWFDPYLPRSRWNRYLEAWDLLKRSSASRRTPARECRA